MQSLHARLLVAASVVLLGFLSLAGTALDRAFRESALAAVEARLQTQIYMLLAAADLDSTGRLRLPEILPEARLSTPGSGLYGEVINAKGDRIWRSASALGLTIPYPRSTSPGQTRFESVLGSNGMPLFALVFTVTWETGPSSAQRYSFRVAESQQSYAIQLAGFRRSMWVWFAAAGLILLALQGLVLRWALAPVRRVARELSMIEQGKEQQLSGRYPKEIRQLTENLNALLRHSREQLERYRRAMADLAHSLKTPLAVLQGTVEKQGLQNEWSEAVEEQVARMQQAVDYQLQRAAAFGKRALAAPLQVEPVARRILESLAKVYAGKSLAWSLDVEPGTAFLGDEGDLMEVLGNLADNAFKWARARVAVRGRPCASPHSPGPGLILEIEDDGPGIPEHSIEAVLGRGVRADRATPGHGIGLAVVNEIVEKMYQGELRIDTGPLGGARLTLRL